MTRRHYPSLQKFNLFRPRSFRASEGNMCGKAKENFAVGYTCVPINEIPSEGTSIQDELTSPFGAYHLNQEEGQNG